jgi:alcohol dehydrogenase (cytochrome c)
MYLTLPGGDVAALDATTGDTIWRYKRNYSNPSPETNSGRNKGFNPGAVQGMNLGNLPSFVTQGGAGGSSRSKSLAIYDDMIYFTAADEAIVALDAKTGKLRWEAKTEAGRGNTTGAIVVEGKVISSGTCGGRATRDACNITAHDAHTGALVWKFMITQAPDDVIPGLQQQVDSWAGVPVDQRKASSWGLPGSYDAETHTLLWSVANPTPYTRKERHGDSDAIPLKAPADLYSNSTLAIDPTTGKLKWYYQHLPGDDWDQDMNEERVILHTKIKPDPKHVRWISNKLKPNKNGGEERDIVVNVGEGGGLWALDKHNGEFLWAEPFPADVKNFILSDIDVNTGATIINREQVLDAPGAHRTVCYFNTRSYWPTAYSPLTNSLYVPYINNCLDMTAGTPGTATTPPKFESRFGVPLPGTTSATLNGIAKVDMKTGVITRWPSGPIPTNSAILATAGNLIFWGDINRRYRAIDADTGKVLWQTILGGPISNGNITYSVNGRQYIAVLTGANLSHPGLNTGTMGPMQLNLDNSGDINAITVFALPER